jgi:GNAT superfamily N-acetyltransferase
VEEEVKMREQPPNIRNATEEDVPAIASIILELGWFKSANEEHIRRHLAMCNADDSHTVLVAENPHGKVSGYITVHWLPYLILPGSEGFVSEMFVLQNERRKGYGRSLIEAVKAIALEKGCIRLALLNSRNRPSYEREYYRRLGWIERAEMADFVYPLGYE